MPLRSSSHCARNILGLVSVSDSTGSTPLRLRIVAADSGSAILDENYRPKAIVAASSIVTEPPYRNASAQISDLLMVPANRHDLIVSELRMCKRMLQMVAADVVHIDMSLGGPSVSQLTISDLSEMPISSRAKQNVREALPELRKLATEIEQKYKVEVLAIGKESVAIRIAELTAGACSVVYASRKALEQRSTVLLGLPTLCTVTVSENQLTSHSFRPSEHDLVGSAFDFDEVTHRVQISEFNNPTVRGFKILKIRPKET